jgi:hypothetical protein
MEVQTPAAQDTTKAVDETKNQTQQAEPVQKAQTQESKAETPNEASTTSKENPKTETKAEDKPNEEKVVPEKYDLKLSEGSALDPAALDRIAALAKAQGLDQEEAAEFLKMQEEDVQAFVTERKQTWLQQLKDDKELGGDNFNENVALSSRVIEKYASPGLKAELAKTGYGNHPELVRMFARLGKEMADDKAILPPNNSKGQKSLEELFYPSHKQEGA